MSEHGYSGTPLARKLGIKPGFRLQVVGYEGVYESLFSDLPPDLTFVARPTNESLDLIHLFVTTHVGLREQGARLIPFLKKDGALWVSWPKGTSSIPTEINRENVRAALLQRGLVDVKVCAVDADWSGLKFVYRTVDR